LRTQINVQPGRHRSVEGKHDEERYARAEDSSDFLEDAQASVFRRRIAALPVGTHCIFIGKVERVRASSSVQPLIFHDAAYCTFPSAIAVAARAAANER
jgi:flavin reductase (DIM6/NTAB) family NADH-FMN oxidoreductase RutF